MLVRTVFIESIGRYERLFLQNTPSFFAQYVERVAMVKGRLSIHNFSKWQHNIHLSISKWCLKSSVSLYYIISTTRSVSARLKISLVSMGLIFATKQYGFSSISLVQNLPRRHRKRRWPSIKLAMALGRGFVQINGKIFYRWCVVSHGGEVL